MGLDGLAADFRGFLVQRTRNVPGLFRASRPVDKSVVFPTRRESVPLESGKLREEPVEVVRRSSVQMAGVEEIGIGDHGGRAFADAAVRDQPVGGDGAAA